MMSLRDAHDTGCAKHESQRTDDAAVKAQLGSTAGMSQSDFAQLWGKGATAYYATVLDKDGPCLAGPAISHFVTDVSHQLKTLPEPHTILDLASAAGQPGLDLAGANPTALVTVSDYSEEMVITARRVGKTMGHSNISCLVVDAADLSQFPDASFTAVTCSAGIFFIAEWKRAVKEWVRVLKPGGYLAISAWQPRDKVQLQTVLGGLMPVIMPEMKGPPAPALNNHSNPQPLLAELKNMGLDDVARRDLNVPMVLPQKDIATFITMPPLGMMVAKFVGQDAAKRQRVVEIVQQIAADMGCLREDGAVVMPENLMHYITAKRPAST